MDRMEKKMGDRLRRDTSICQRVRHGWASSSRNMLSFPYGRHDDQVDSVPAPPMVAEGRISKWHPHCDHSSPPGPPLERSASSRGWDYWATRRTRHVDLTRIPRGAPRSATCLRKALANPTALSHDQLDELHELKLLVTEDEAMNKDKSGNRTSRFLGEPQNGGSWRGVLQVDG